MLITGVKAKDWDRYAHEAVFGAVSSLKQVRAILDGTQQIPADVEALVNFNWKHNQSIFLHTLRVALLYTMWQRNLDLMIADKANKNDLKALHAMKRCTPDGVFTDIKPTFHCRLYRPCPWCRYRKALEILERLGSKLGKTKRIAVAKFSSPCAMADMDFEGNRAVIEALCKKKRTWHGDYVITLPVWLQDTDYVNQHTSEYTPVWETSIIVFADQSTELLLPENAVTPKARNKHNMAFSSPGGWIIWEGNTKQNLSEALKYVMEYPLYLASKQMDPIESLVVLDSSNQLRAVGHGILR